MAPLHVRSKGRRWRPCFLLRKKQQHQKRATQRVALFCGYPQVLLSELPYIARKGECEGGTFDGFPRSRSVTRPQATDFAQQNRCSKKKRPPTAVFSFWSRIRESNPPPRLGKPMYYRCTNPAYEVFIAVLCTADTGVLRQLRCLRVPAHFLLAVPKAAMLRIAAVLRRQNACDRTRLLGLGSRCTTDVRILRCMDPAWSSWIS